MSWREDPLLIACADDTLVGVLARPDLQKHPASQVAVVIVVGGPQYRAGSHRQFVQLARVLADSGFATLRFDVRGMGDASGAKRTFDQLDDDIAAAIGTVQTTLPDVRRVVLWGLCDGASAALLYWHRTRDPRVAGLCLLNPWVRSATSLARAHVKHYYGRRLMQRDFWLKALKGKVRSSALVDLMANLRTAIRARSERRMKRGGAPAIPFQHIMASGWHAFEGPILLVLSELDYTAKEFLEHVAIESPWKGSLGRENLSRVDMQGADHTFSSVPIRRSLESTTVQWLRNQVERRIAIGSAI